MFLGIDITCIGQWWGYRCYQTNVFGLITASLTWRTRLWVFEKDGIKETFKEFAGLQSLSYGHSSQDTMVHVIIKPRLGAFIVYFPQTYFWWPSREMLPIYHQMHQPTLHISSQCRNSSLLLYTAFGYHPSPNTGGQKSSRNLSLALGGKFVNTPTQQERFDAWLPGSWTCFQVWLKPHSGQGHSLTRKCRLPESSSVFQTLQKLETAAEESPLLPKQGQGNVPPWKESSSTSAAPGLMVPDLTPLQKQKTFIQAASTLLETTLDSL